MACHAILITIRVVRRKSETTNAGIFGLSAAMGEFAAATIRNPTEVVKQNMQMLSYGGVGSAIKNIWQVRGARGFYAGYLPLLCREIPFSLIQLPIFEFIQKRIKLYCYFPLNLPYSTKSLEASKYQSLYKALISGFISGAIAGFLTTPCDVIKTRMMTNTVKEYKITPVQWVRKIVSEEGLAALYKGWHVRIVYLSFGGAVYFLSYRLALNWLKLGGEYNKARQQ